jgi:MOSC domain-containing protein YiiM
MPEPASRFTLVAVAVGKPSLLGHNRQGEVISGIRKHHVAGQEVVVRTLNIDGDGQADLRAHGGVDKAVYCYPREHRAWWQSEIGYARDDAPFGENLSVEGVTEDEVRIGDTWRWGTALLQVSQPRWPCFKLALHTERPDMVKRFVASGRSGWYLRVLEEGVAPTTGSITVEQRDPREVSVLMAFLAARGDLDPALFDRANGHPALANAWRRDRPREHA